MLPRTVLAFLLFVRAASADEGIHFRADAERMAKEPYAPGYIVPTEFAKKLTYDVLQKTRVKRQFWGFQDSPGQVRVEPQIAGGINSKGVEVAIREDGKVKVIAARPDVFEFPEGVPLPREEDLSGFKGFCVHGPPQVGAPSQEQFTFGGASYFRGHSENRAYGLSGRGLILNRDGKEEFPMFERFLVEEPATEGSSVVLHALLNSPSATGAFRFTTTPGDPLTMEVQAILFPRAGLFWNDLGVGLAGFSSMYWFSPASANRAADFRERVHDSEGLSISMASGERIWRVLTNPARIHEKYFPASGLKGFGLIQRERSFYAYDDDEARYDNRVSAWIVPVSGMEAGRIRMMEIPTTREFDDNIVACFQPDFPPKANQPLNISYRILWSDDTPAEGPARVLQTRVGAVPNQSDVIVFTVDFEKRDTAENVAPIVKIPDVLEQRFAHLKTLPDGKRLRLHLGVTPRRSQGEESGEISAHLAADGKPVSETWVYPWNGSPN